MIRRPPRSTLFPLHDALPILRERTGKPVLAQDEIIPEKLADYLRRHPEHEARLGRGGGRHYQVTDLTPGYEELDRKSTRLNSSHANISYAVFCLKKKKQYTAS